LEQQIDFVLLHRFHLRDAGLRANIHVNSRANAQTGRVSKAQAGITLIEMLIVMSIVALIVGLSYPSAAGGLDAMRVRSASDSMVSFLNAAIDRAERNHQVVEVWISPKEGALIARSPDGRFQRRLDLSPGIRMVAVHPLSMGLTPEMTAQVAQEPRRFLMYPGGTVPRMGIEIASEGNRHKLISVDPITGTPRSLDLGSSATSPVASSFQDNPLPANPVPGGVTELGR
jgi:prepilin-type N-terminal cleavage/methylation domain-containing protein